MNALQKPLSAFFDMNVGVAGWSGRRPVRVIAVLGPKGRHGCGVAFLKGINERLGVIKNGFFVVPLLIRCDSRQ
jgi:hypothetical protein